jgi:hypothetical protein
LDEVLISEYFERVSFDQFRKLGVEITAVSKGASTHKSSIFRLGNFFLTKWWPTTSDRTTRPTHKQKKEEL